MNKKQKGSIREAGGHKNIAVSKETRDKLKEIAGDVPLSRFLKRIAESGAELKQPSSIVTEVNTMIAAMVKWPTILNDAAGFPGEVNNTAEWLDKAELAVLKQIRQGFSELRQAKLPEIETVTKSVPKTLHTTQSTS